MILDINKNKPLTMHIDLNSCFATVMQQAYVHLRNKPMVVAAYDSANGCVLSPSMEAKRFGIKTGMTVRQSRMLCPQVIVRTPDPPMIRDVHVKFMNIFKDYTPSVVPKSVDEAILEFVDIETYIKGDLVWIGEEIKRRIRNEIGEWISCSVGIGTNRFLAKTAASLKKPDGLEVITYKNLLDVYNKLSLTDLNGINVRYEARLNQQGIFTPLQFIGAPAVLLKQNVFQSIVGFYWYMRLRGHEVDKVEYPRRSFGQDYALQKPVASYEELAPLLMKLCEKMGRRLRASGNAAYGIHVACLYGDGTYWHRGRKKSNQLYTTAELFRSAMRTLREQPEQKVVRKIMISCYELVPCESLQPTLFDIEPEKERKIARALDAINNKYGEYTVVPALMMGMGNTILDRIAFGKTT